MKVPDLPHPLDRFLSFGYESQRNINDIASLKGDGKAKMAESRMMMGSIPVQPALISAAN